MPLFAGPGVTPSLRGLTTNVVNLQPGQVYTVPPGWFYAKTGKYTTLQEFDPITTCYRGVGAGPTDGFMEFNYSDGNNYRLANQTGCAVGARVTVAGSAYTSRPTVAASAGNSIWLPIIGGLVNTTVTVTNGGVSYTYPPQVLFAAPPSPGVQATGYCTISAGAVTSVTVTDQGAGYISPPTIQFINDPREGVNGVTAGYNASAIATLTGAGTLAALLCLDHGTPLTSLPTLTITGGGGASGAGIVIMDWTVTSYSIIPSSSGAGYSGNVLISAYGGFTTSPAAYTNPTIEQNLLKGRSAQIIAALSGAALTTAGQSVQDGGIYPGVPNWISQFNTPPTTAAFVTLNVGGVQDVSILLTT